MSSDNKYAIVTGASSGIGRAVAAMLLSEGYEVMGIGRTFEGEYGFDKVIMDLRDTDKLIAQVRQTVSQKDVRILVNCAGSAYYGLHENLSAEKIAEMTDVDLKVPAILCSLVLREFKQKKDGWIINVSSVTASEVNPHGAMYGALKAGLSSLSRSLFAEARKHNVKIIDIAPDLTDTALYRNADFCADGSDPMACLRPEDVAQAISDTLHMRDGAVMSSIRLVPQYHRIKKKEGGDDR